MPDRNGVPTLRDKFPLYCAICKRIIVSAQYSDGVLITAEEDYRMIGIVKDSITNINEAPIPICVYGHLSCIGTREIARQRAIVLITHICDYCGSEISSGNACAVCLARIKRENQVRQQVEIVPELQQGSIAVQELIQNLAAMRSAAAETLPVVVTDLLVISPIPNEPDNEPIVIPRDVVQHDHKVAKRKPISNENVQDICGTTVEISEIPHKPHKAKPDTSDVPNKTNRISHKEPSIRNNDENAVVEPTFLRDREDVSNMVLIDDTTRLGNYEPINELGVVFMLGKAIKDLGYKIAHMDGRYPDCIMCSPSGKTVRVELEFLSSNFLQHHHNPNLCDLVICWIHDAKLPVPVLALHQYYKKTTDTFDFSMLKKS